MGGAAVPHVTVSFPPEDESDERARMEDDEDEMRRANAEVLQMQQQMIDGQPQIGRASCRERVS